MAYGLAEGFRKTVVRLGGKKKNRAVVIATFGNHFSMNDAIEKFRERAEQVRSIIREHLGYVEPL